MKKAAIFLILLLITGAGVSALFKEKQEKPLQATIARPAPAVDVVTPHRSTLQRVIEVYGSLSPKTVTELKSEIVGRVHRIHVKEWDRVKPKDVLLEVDPTDFKLAVSRNEAGLKMAKAQLLQARVDFDRAKREWNRAMKLKEGGLITGKDLDENKTALESAEARVALAQAQVAQAEAQVAESRHVLEKTAVSSPIEGIISERKVDIGDFLDKGTMLFTIVDNRLLDFTATVPATDLPLVAEGQPLLFTVDGMPERTFEGRIKRVNPMVSSTDRSGRILAEVRNTEGLLRGGLYARGRVVVEERKDALVLPKAALNNWNMEKNTATIFIVDDNWIVHSVPVMTGLTDTHTVEIRAGVTGTERVVVRGGFNIKDGDKVQVTD